MIPPVVVNPTLQEILDLVGVFVFALSGALLAVRKDFDIIGMLVLAEITALGGGVIRDLVIGAVPPVAFTDLGYLLAPMAATVLTFFAHPHIERIVAAVLVFNAAGLGLFCVTGTAKALAHGLGPAPAAALGVTTAIGGGILRDVLANDIPAVFRVDSEWYTIPAVLGAAIVVGAEHMRVYGPLAAGIAAAVAFVLRLIALRRGLRAPRPRRAIGAR